MLVLSCCVIGVGLVLTVLCLIGGIVMSERLVANPIWGISLLSQFVAGSVVARQGVLLLREHLKRG